MSSSKQSIFYLLSKFITFLLTIIRALKLPLLSILSISIFSYILLIAKINIALVYVYIQISLIVLALAFFGRFNWLYAFCPFPLWALFLGYIWYKFLVKNKKNNLKNKNFQLSKYPKLSIVGIFANKLETKNIYTAYVLLITTAAYSILGILWEKFELNIYFMLGGLIYASLLYLNTFLVKFRIKKGFYGGNEFEAREIINFIEENSENIDFGDGDSPKKLFNEEDLKEMEESTIKLNNDLPQPNT